MSKDTIYREDAIKALHEEWDGGWLEVTGEWIADNCEIVLNRLSSADRPSGENCEFCRCHEKEDVLYELVDWDYGLAFDEIRNIKYCPLCGVMLKGADDDY